MDVTKMKVADLKKELKLRNLSTVGNKQELSDRLLGVLDNSGDNSLVLDDDANVEDDDLGGEDEEGIDADDLTDDVAIGLEVDSSTASTPATKPAKKIALQRNNLPALEKENVEKEETGSGSEPTDGDHKTVNLKKVTLTAQDRLALRAQKFGTSAVEPSKAESRAARFGITKDTPITKIAGIVPPLDVLKRRAERFGTCSTLLETAEIEERKQQRRQRFGLQEPATAASKVSLASVKSTVPIVVDSDVTEVGPGSKRPRITGPAGGGSVSTSADDEKKKLRAQRFKLVK